MNNQIKEEGLKDAYLLGKYDGIKQGRADYEAECQKIFEDNPPMHFNHEQIMWLKEFVKIRCNQARADAFDEFAEKIMDIMPNDIDAKVHNGSICLDILALAEQLKEQK